MGNTITQEQLYTIPLKRLGGEQELLEKYRGQVLLVVNVASKCGFTGQYRDLQSLYDEFHSQGFTILGFPCNQFGFQEPGDAQEVAKFCSTTYQVAFPMFAKTDVNGSDAHPLFEYLKSKQRGFLGLSSIKWNFTKFLVSRNGEVVGRFSPSTNPSKLKAAIVAELARGSGS